VIESAPVQAVSSSRWWSLAPLGVWLAVYPALMLLGHFALETHALDLSVFDYALNGCRTSACGDVPFLGHTLGSHHVMPTLYLLSPVYHLWPSPVFLILVQAVSVAGAALLLWRLCDGRSRWAAAALLALFLFSRRTHSAIVSVFYPEAWLPVLTFLAIWAALQRKWVWFWVATLLALGTREDVGVYFAIFGAVLAWRGPSRRHGVACLTVSLIWVAVATFMVLPSQRESEGLDRANPFVAERIGSDPWRIGASRVMSLEAAGKVAGLLGAAGALPLLAPVWLAPAVPGIMLNLATGPEFVQSGLVGHYLWPMLPWVWVAAAFGLATLERAGRRVVLGWAVLMFVVVVADSPISTRRIQARWTSLDASQRVINDLQRVPADASVLAQPHLLPHLAKRPGVQIMAGARPETPANVVVFSQLGNQWPLTEDEWARRREAVAADPRCTHVPTDSALIRFDCR
jgi:uncharacterized membrane protein